MKPNLFSLATKELSQDAFLAWLLQWADPKCRKCNPMLNDVVSLIEAEHASAAAI